jgi:hypothetical protein
MWEAVTTRANAGASSLAGARRALSLAPAVAWSTVLAVVLLSPLYRSGYPLARDMVFTPRPHLSWSSVGLGSGAPRAVPVDALVALASSVLGGAVVSRVALLVPLVVAGAGVAALVGRARPLGATAAASLAVWNPYVVERLAMGDWSLLWAYAALPWIVLLARFARNGGTSAPVLIAVGFASITPTGGLLALLTATVCLWPDAPTGRRRWALVTVAALALQLPWIVPGIVGSAKATSDAAGVAAFAARPENGGGVLGSLLGGGGAWNADAVPPSRSGWLGVVALFVVVVAAFGWSRARTALGAATLTRLAWCAGIGVGLALASSLPGVDAVVRWAVRTIPGAGIVRDAQKWLMPYLVLVAVLFGCVVSRLVTRGPARLAVTALAVLTPILVLPDAAGTLRPVLDPVTYPRDWGWAATATGRGGAVLVLPFQPYRAFSWAPGRPVLDPAPRLLPGQVIVSDRLTVSGTTLGGEDRRAARIASILSARAPSSAALAREGIGWVLVEHGTPGHTPDIAGLRLARAGSDVSLYRVPGPVASVRPGTAQRVVVLVVDGLALLVLIGAAGTSVRRRAGC